MLKVNLLCVGNLKDKFFIEASNEYEKRLSRFCTLNIKEVKEYTNFDNIEQVKNAEGEEILKHLKGFVVIMDIKGNALSSEQLALKIKEISLQSGEITFVIGGSYGIAEKVKERANFSLSVSKMTFPHRLFRIMLLEQIYRAFTILNNVKYHK